MGWISQSPEAWAGLALLIVIVSAVTHIAFSRTPDARMDFFLRLLANLPNDDVFAPNAPEASPVQLTHKK
jgi:hypothetical protein